MFTTWSEYRAWIGQMAEERPPEDECDQTFTTTDEDDEPTD